MGNSIAVTKVHGNIVSDSESESESSKLQVEIGDFITVKGRKVYVVSDFTKYTERYCSVCITNSSSKQSY
jgi:hypothetical protein